MGRFLVSIAAFAVGGAFLFGPAGEARAASGGWWPVYEDPGFFYGSNRPFWWSDLGPTPYWGGTIGDQVLGLPYSAWYGPSTTYTYRVGPAIPRPPIPYYVETPAPVVSARSVAAGSLGRHCSTPVKTCSLRQASDIGGGCSCKVSGGQAHGSITP